MTKNDIFIAWSGAVPTFNIEKGTLTSHYVRTAPELTRKMLIFLLDDKRQKKITIIFGHVFSASRLRSMLF